MTRATYNFKKEDRASFGTVINIQADPAGRLTRAAIEDLMELLKKRENRILELEKRLHAISHAKQLQRS